MRLIERYFALKFLLLAVFLIAFYLVSGCGDGALSDSTEQGVDESVTIYFLAVGDTGTGDEIQQNVADAMVLKCSQNPCDFVLLLGDNFYSSGVTSVDDPLFEIAFEIPYADLNIPFYPILGNHDVMGSTQAQIDYSQFSQKWIMPDRYYSHAHPSEKPVVEFFAIDSTNFDEEQETWLDTGLKNSLAVWKIFYDHYPYFSNGISGDNIGSIATSSADTTCNRIDLIISGHDHTKEHLIGSTDGCVFHQLVLGSGGGGLYDVNPDERSFFASKTYGFGWFAVSEDEIYFEFIDTEGNVEYSYRLIKTLSS